MSKSKLFFSKNREILLKPICIELLYCTSEYWLSHIEMQNYYKRCFNGKFLQLRFVPRTAQMFNLHIMVH